MKISIFGLGYVGSVSLACLARNGHKIIGVDTNNTKVEFINNGKTPIVEKETDVIIREQRSLGNISATTNGIDAVKKSAVSFICVGTPSANNGHLDLRSVYNVSKEIAEGIRQKNTFHTVAIRSTVLPGTNQKVSQIIERTSGKTLNKDFAVVSNPEFLREGTAVQDFYNPPYTLVGTNAEEAVKKMRIIYRGITAPFIVTDIKIAEMIKYVNNAFHALKITFANEIGNICKRIGIDSYKLMEIFCLDKKLNISASYLKPGFAYGGSCLPKDLKALSTIAHDQYLECTLLQNIERSNEHQKDLVLKRIMEFNVKNIGFLGLSFKPNTDDLRESPIVDIIERLLGKGYNVLIYDRNVHLSKLVGANREYILKKIPYVSEFITDDPKALIEKSQAIVVVHNDAVFCDILDNVDSNVIVFDLVNYEFAKRSEITYQGIAW